MKKLLSLLFISLLSTQAVAQWRVSNNPDYGDTYRYINSNGDVFSYSCGNSILDDARVAVNINNKQTVSFYSERNLISPESTGIVRVRNVTNYYYDPESTDNTALVNMLKRGVPLVVTDGNGNNMTITEKLNSSNLCNHFQTDVDAY